MDKQPDFRPRWLASWDGAGVILINAGLLLALLLGWTCMTATAPAVVAPAANRARLAVLEDAVARDPADVDAADELAEAYLASGRPGFALAMLQSVDGAHRRAPRISHRLAQAYELMGRLDDARTMAELTMARCEGELGSMDAGLPSGVDSSRRLCTESELASYAVHRQALVTLGRWGVIRPDDPRRPVAYRLARRIMRVAASQ